MCVIYNLLCKTSPALTSSGEKDTLQLEKSVAIENKDLNKLEDAEVGL